jgi:hypothetical protein
MSVHFNPLSEQVEFNYRNEPTRFRGPIQRISTQRKNGPGYKTYKKVGVTANMNKRTFFKEGAFRGPPTKKNKSFAKFQAQQEGLVRKRGENPVRWAMNFHRYVNENENTNNNNNNGMNRNNKNLLVQNKRSMCQKVCNAFGRCFCSRRGGKTMKKRKD